MESAPIFSWIHLSDLHFGSDQARHSAGMNLVLGALRDNVLDQVDKKLWPIPNAVLISGDITTCGRSEGYQLAIDALARFVNDLGLTLADVFAVPGNHDVDRAAAKRSRSIFHLVERIRDGHYPIDQALSDTNEREWLRERLDNYHKFSAALAKPTSQAFDGLAWSHRFPDKRIRLVGLNSTLVASGADKGRLSIGLSQIDECFARQNIAADEIVISMSHHPIVADWLRDHQDTAGELRRYAHIHLTGHLHHPDSGFIQTGGGQSIIYISGAAAHEAPRPDHEFYRHGYNYAGIYPTKDDKLELRVYPRRYGENRDFRRDEDNLEEELGYACHPLTQKRRSRLR